MPSIQAFRGIRYDLGHVGDLSDVIAPPYDVIDAELQRSLYDRHESNSVRLILNRDEEGDNDDNNRYTRAGQLFRSWQRDGVLFTEGDPAVYVYHQEFEAEGQTFVRRGFMTRVRLERFGEGKIYPHEETHARAKADRLKLWNTTRANMSQIFGLYPDEENVAQETIEKAILSVAPLQATDHLGVVHKLWPVTDIETISQLTAAMDDRPVFIADGHHRYETACTYRDELAASQGGSLPADHPANFVLMMCVSMSDPGMIVLPTHRLFRGVPAMTKEALAEKLGSGFDLQPGPTGPEGAQPLWDQIQQQDDQGNLALYTAVDDSWTFASINDQGRARLAEIASDRSDDWQQLGVSILHRLLIDDLLDLGSLPTPKYVHSIDEVVEGLKEGDSTGRDHTGQEGSGEAFQLGALVMPATVNHIQSISAAGERMPAKSTYFFPKLLSGLLFNPLE